MSSDSHGNFYIFHGTFLRGNKKSIDVFTNSGQLLRSFGRKESSYPRGMCIFGEYVYVTDCEIKDHIMCNADSQNVFVYTTEGEEVTSLKQCSDCDLNKPEGICADKDGYIYICANGRVYVF